MKRSSSQLKPLAPRPEGFAVQQAVMFSGPQLCNGMQTGLPMHSWCNRNAFVGANLGVPASPLEAFTSMDPKDYVWGTPTIQGGYCHPPNFMYGYQQHSVLQHQQPGNMPVSNGLSASAAPSACLTGVPQLVQQDTQQLSLQVPEASNSESKDAPNSLPETSDGQMTDLIDGLDEDCIKRLLEGNPGSFLSSETDDLGGECAGLGPLPGSPGGHSGKPQFLQGRLSSMTPSDTSVITGEGSLLGKSPFGEGFGASDTELLDGADLSFIEDSHIKHVPSFGDLDLDYLTSIHELELEATSQPLEVGSVADLSELRTCGSMGGGGSSKSAALKRTKSTPALKKSSSKASFNPLLNLAVEDALLAINDFLQQDDRVPEEKRSAAMAAIHALQDGQTKPLSSISDVLPGKGVVTKKKRSALRTSPRRMS